MRKGLLFGEKKHAIRASGLRTEKKFFGKRGIFARAGHTKHLKNAKGDYTGTLKLPTYIDRAVAAVLHDGPSVLDWEWDRRMSPENKQHFHNFLVSVHHPLAYEGMTPEQRFKRFIMDHVMPRIEKNPKDFHNIEKSGFHRGQYVGYGGGTWRITKYGKGERTWIAVKQGGGGEFYGSSFADLSAKLDLLASKKNPITLNGNPPKEIHTTVAGILYNRCLEIRAEKTTAKGLKGLYYHPFLERSQVCILALDNGDLLIHSKAGESLWKPI